MPRAEIATTQAKHTLEQLHAELGGKILDNKKEADRLREAMVHVEAVLKLLDPSHNLRTIAVRRRKPNPWFKRGTVCRSAFDVLRRATEPLTVSEIALQMLKAKCISDAPRSEVAKLEGAIRCSLNAHPNTEKITNGDELVRWSYKQESV
jgi:hypothetical protein